MSMMAEVLTGTRSSLEKLEQALNQQSSSGKGRLESPRLSRRLQTLRGWSHEQQIDEVRTRGA